MCFMSLSDIHETIWYSYKLFNLQNLIIITYLQMHIKYYNAVNNQSIPG